MRLLFVTREPRLYSMRRFQQACQAEGHAFSVLDALATNIILTSDGGQLWSGGDPVRREAVDAVVPRIGPNVTEQGCAVVAQFEAMGVPAANGSEAILRARDKLRALQYLAGARIPIPRTAVVREVEDVDEAVDAVGGLPCVLKLLRGTQGIGVMLAESREALESVLQAFWSLGHTILLQQFIRESKGKDVRAFVVGDRVVGAMRRKAPVGEFRSNIHRGGEGQALELSAEEETRMVQAARVLGLEVAGVDYLESNDGPKIIEVNASPGFQGLEAATGKDVATEVVRHAARLAEGGRR